MTPDSRSHTRRNSFSIPLVLSLCAFAILMVWGICGLSQMAADRGDRLASGVPSHFPDLEMATVSDSPDLPVIHYEGFSLCFDEKRHTPVWVGWELLRSEADGNQARSNRFWQDDDVYGCPSPADYTRSGFDRGHMCPAADQKWSARAMRDCFSMANMVPQDHALNSGAWATLEKKERAWALRDSAVVIVAGPIYSDSDNRKIGASGIHVPGAFFKVLLAPYLEKPRAIAFVFPNMASPGNMQNYALSVDEVENITGIDFFPSLPDSIENQVEAVFSFTDWNRR